MLRHEHEETSLPWKLRMSTSRPGRSKLFFTGVGLFIVLIVLLVREQLRENIARRPRLGVLVDERPENGKVGSESSGRDGEIQEVRAPGRESEKEPHTVQNTSLEGSEIGEKEDTGTMGGDIEYVLFDYWYGQFNNQLSALAVAISITQMFAGNATLVLPPIKLGMESRSQYWDALGSKETPAPIRIVGDYLDMDEIRKIARVMQYDSFLETEVGKLAQKTRLCLYDERVPTTPNSSKIIYETTFGMTNLVPIEWTEEPYPCLKYSSTYIEAVRECSAMKNVVLLPKTFSGQSFDCSLSYPKLRASFAHLIPRKEYRRSVSELFAALEGPIVGLHIRLLEKHHHVCLEKLGGPSGYVNILKNRFSGVIATAKSIFVAFNPTDPHLAAIFDELVREFSTEKRIVSCNDMVNCGNVKAEWARTMTELEFGETFRSPYSFSLMDMWALASSDEFIGTSGSTFTGNIHRWRALGTPSLRNGDSTPDADYRRHDIDVCIVGIPQ